MQSYCDHRYLHSFPTRRSSDLDIAPPRLLHRVEPIWPETARGLRGVIILELVITRDGTVCAARVLRTFAGPVGEDRKSTRLNSSHGYISYAVFCLKKKKHRDPC